MLGQRLLLLLLPLLFLLVDAQRDDDETALLHAAASQGLPLKVQTMLPKSYPEGEDFTLTGRTTLTVVFNRAVVPIGFDFGSDLTRDSAAFPFEGIPANIPGKFRWVTTSIARFDPDVAWPNDVDFTLTVPARLAAFDGAVIVAPPAQRYKTAVLRMDSISVFSDSALAATDGRWPLETELLDDGAAELTFSHPVAVASVADVLRVQRTAGGERLPVRVSECTSVRETCVRVTPTATVAPGVEFKAVIPAGSVVHPYAGPTDSATSQLLTGLVPFKFDFLSNRNQRLSTTRLQLHLVHGLDADGDEAAMLAALENAIHVTNAAGDEVQIANFEREEKAVVAFEIPYVIGTGTGHRIRVDASDAVRDAYGQPLQASEASFTMGSPSFINIRAAANSRLGLFFVEDDFDLPYAALVRTSDSVTCSAVHGLAGAPVAATSLSAALGHAASCEETIISGRLEATASDAVSSTSAEWLELPNSFISSSTGLGLAWSRKPETCSRCATGFGGVTLVNKVTAAVSAVQTGDEELSVWVVDSANDGAPISSAVVALYRITTACSGSCASPSTRALADAVSGTLASGTTDANGLVHLDTPALIQRAYNNKYIIATTLPSGRMIITKAPTFYENWNMAKSRQALLSDRLLYDAGEIIHLFGYVRETDDSGTLTSPSSATVDISYTFKSGYGSERLTARAEYDAEYGSFAVDIDVPADADPGKKWFSASIQIGSDTSASAQLELTIASPRLPVAQLDVAAVDDIVAPQQPVQVQIGVSTFTGVPVPNAKVTVAWKLTRAKCTSDGEATGTTGIADAAVTAATSENVSDSGTTEVNVDENGALLLTVPTVFGGTEADGDVLAITVSYVDNSGAPLSADATVTFGSSNLAIRLRPTTWAPLPGLNFGVFVDVFDRVSGESVTSQSVALRVVEAENALRGDDGLLTIASGTSNVDACTATSNGGSTVACRLAVPAVGHYVLLAEFTDSAGARVQSALALGKTADEWADEPLKNFDLIQVRTDKTEYRRGDTVRIPLDVPFANARAYVSWRMPGGTASSANGKVQALSKGANEITFTADETTCRYGCGVSLLINVPRQSAGDAVATGVATSPYFDINMPRVLSYSLSVQVADDDHSADVTVAASQAVAAPGTTVPVTVSAPAGSMVTVMAVNKPVLELQPHPLPSLGAYFDATTSTSSTAVAMPPLAKTSGYSHARDFLSAVLERNPIRFHYNWPTSPESGETSDVDKFIRDNAQSLTSMPHGGDRDYASQYCQATQTPRYYEMDAYADFAPAAGGGDESADGAGAGSPSPAADAGVATLRSDFDNVPLFATSLTVGPTGSVSANLELPDNVGSFVLRTFVVTRTHQFGSAESELVVRNPINLEAKVPRIVRFGDDFFAGVIPSVTDSGFDDSVTITLESITGGVQVADEESSERVVAMRGDGQGQGVTFSLSAVAVGPVSIVFAVVANSDSSLADRVETTFHVHGIQLPVLVATSLALDGSEAAAEQLELPDALPGSGSVSVTAGVGSLPSVMAFSQSVWDAVPSETMYNAHSGSILALLAPLAGHRYGQAAFDSDANENAERAWALLSDRTTSAFGLRPYASSSFAQSSADLWTNGRASFIAFLLADADASVARNDLVTKWRSAFGQALVQQAEEYRSLGYGPYSNFDMIALARLVLGADWGPTGGSLAVFGDLTMARLEDNADALSINGQAYLALMGRDSSAAQLARLESALRVQGRTAYVTNDVESGTASAASLDSQALALFALVRNGRHESNALVQKLQAYVGAGGASRDDGVYWFDPYASALAIMALTDYDNAVGNTAPDVSLHVASGDVVLLDAEFRATDAQIAESKTTWEDLGAPAAAPLSASVDGSGQVSLAIGMTFVPAILFPKPVYRGIFIERVMQRADPATGEATGPAIDKAVAGEMVVVTLQISTPDDLSDVVVTDPVPGGLEPVDDNLAGQSSPTTSNYNYYGNYMYAKRHRSFSIDAMFGPWSPSFDPFSIVETRPESVTFKAHRIWAGSHMVQYTAVVNTQGSFVHPSAKAEVEQQPELMGLSAASMLAVAADTTSLSETTVRELPLAATSEQQPKNLNIRSCASGSACKQPSEAMSLEDLDPMPALPSSPKSAAGTPSASALALGAVLVALAIAMRM